jgi:hypothetical protein
MKTMICIGFLLFALSAAYAQIQPIDHNMKNLNVGNVFIYKYDVLSFDHRIQGGTTYFIRKILRNDTLNNKVYAVFQNGTRERADSSGVYWLPIDMNTQIPFTTERLQYPLFPIPKDTIQLPNCRTLVGASHCASESTTERIYKPVSVYFEGRGDTIIFNKLVKTYIFNPVFNGFCCFAAIEYAKYSTFFGPYHEIDYGSLYLRTTTLCGAFIEGKYYGDSACLVASSTPLRGEEFTTLTASLAPNPVSDIATLRFILPTAQGLTVEIRDMLGREVAPSLVFDALSSGMNALPIDVSSIPRGVYAVRLRTALGLRATTLLVKE